MQKGLTITLDEAVYDGLMRVVGRGKVSQFLEALARPHVLDTGMDKGYRAMSNDRQHEAEASEWINGLIGDVANAARRCGGWSSIQPSAARFARPVQGSSSATTQPIEIYPESLLCH